MPSPTRFVLIASLLGLSSSCFDRGDRWLVDEKQSTPRCTPGELRCVADTLERCVAGFSSPTFEPEEDCTESGLICAASLAACAPCEPNRRSCDGTQVLLCDGEGQKQKLIDDCDGEQGESCRNGVCVNLCAEARQQRSNEGCEYWAVDLDNAVIDESSNAAAQQYAVVVGNPQPDLPVTVTIERDDTAPGEQGAPKVIAQADIGPFGLRTFKLGPREVDGSEPGHYNEGTNTAWTRAAYRVRTSIPVIVYQFNPLDNVNVFSNDASLLKPVEALGSSSLLEDRYVVLGWPQTIAITEDPDTNYRNNLRAFLTMVATHDKTHVRLTSKAPVVAGGAIDAIGVDETADFELDAFDVLNLETGSFGADFTGSLIASDNALVVYSGSEASDAPRFDTIAKRYCCADHLEEQLDPIRTAGKRFVAPVAFNRSLALSRAGATIGVTREQEAFRIIAATDKGAHVTTTLGGSGAEFALQGRGDYRELKSRRDFIIESDEPVMVGNVTFGQEAVGIPKELPGGDPSFIIVPPVEQYRQSYVFLTPDLYAFDFLRVVAPKGANLRLDGLEIDNIPSCYVGDQEDLVQSLPKEAAKEFTVYRCQLTFPLIDPQLSGPDALTDGDQSGDGVHELVSDQPVGVIVDGFDRNVSYGYAGGTELREIVAR